MISKNTSENKSKPILSISPPETKKKKKHTTIVIEAQIITFQIDLKQLFGEFIDTSKNKLIDLEFNDLIENETASINAYFYPRTED